VFFLVLVALLLFMLAANSPLQALLGAGIVMLGLPVYALLFRRPHVMGARGVLGRGCIHELR
jgi:APA family basic amino acid/polyamine antiporter